MVARATQAGDRAKFVQRVFVAAVVLMIALFAVRVVGAAAAGLRCAGKAMAAEVCETEGLGAGR